MRKWVSRLDVLAVTALIVSIPAMGYDRTAALHGFYKYFTSEIPLSLLTIADNRETVSCRIRRSCGVVKMQTSLKRLRHKDEATLSGSVSPGRSLASFTRSAGTFSSIESFTTSCQCFRSMRVAVRGFDDRLSGVGDSCRTWRKTAGGNYCWREAPRSVKDGCSPGIAVLLLLEFNAAPITVYARRFISRWRDHAFARDAECAAA